MVTADLIGLSRRAWLLVWVLALAWTGFTWFEGDSVINTDGWPQFRSLWAAALTPELSREFLETAWGSTLTTLAFAVLGTFLAVAIGMVLGVLMSQTWWRSPTASRVRRLRAMAGWGLFRGAAGIPRGIHEVIWGLFLVSVLGSDPVVGVLAIAIPFGAITAKVYSEMIDESARGPYDALRASGASRLSCLCYALIPQTLPDLTSYAFYRFECSIRSAVILGMIGAGGLGHQLMMSFQGLQYDEMWTLIYILIVVCALADRCGSLVRRRRSTARLPILLVSAALIAGSVHHLGLDLSRLLSDRSRALFADLVDQLFPLKLPQGGWEELIDSAVTTLQMSLVAATLSSTLAVVIAFVAARGGRTPIRRVFSAGARWLLLLTRAIPPPVWALLVLFLVFPGPLPGALALGIYNFGVLGRLCAEVVENLRPAPRAALEGLGAKPATAFAYATLPAAATQFVAYSLYRWEVCVRETVIVGVVGAGGLGMMLQQQRAAFDYGAMATTVVCLIIVCLIVDAISAAIRATLR